MIKQLFFFLCLLPMLVSGANIDFRNLNTNHFTTNGYRVLLKNFPTNTPATNYITTLASNYFLTTAGGGITNDTTQPDGYVRTISTPTPTFSSNRKSIQEWKTSKTNLFPVIAVGVQEWDSNSFHGNFEILGHTHSNYANIGGIHWSKYNLGSGGLDDRLAVWRVKSPFGPDGDLGGYTLFENRFEPGTLDAADTFANYLLCDQNGNVGLGHLGAASDTAPGVHPTNKVTVYGTASYDAFGVLVQGTNAFLVTKDRRVAIGTNNPANTFHVQGSAKFDANNSVTDFQIGSYIADEMRLVWRGGTGGLSTNFFGNGVGSIGQQSFSLFTVNTQRWRVTGLSADGVGANLGDIYPDVDAGYSLGTPSRRILNAHFNGAIITNGNVGIGTNAPVATEEIFSADADGALKITSPHGTPFKVDTNGSVSLMDGSSAIPALRFSSAPLMGIYRNSSILSFAGSDGNVAFGALAGDLFVYNNVLVGAADNGFSRRASAHMLLGNGAAGNHLGTLTTSNFLGAGTVTATNGVASFATNIVTNVDSKGYTNSPTAPGTGTGINMNVHIVGTSGTIVFYNRSGLRGETICGTPLWTNTTAIPIGMVIPVPVNCGIQIVSGVGVTMQAYAQ